MCLVQRTTWLIAFVFAAFACAGIWIESTLYDRSSAETAAADKLSTTVGLLGLHADRALEAGDRVVQAAVEAVGDPAGLHQAETLRRLQQRLH